MKSSRLFRPDVKQRRDRLHEVAAAPLPRAQGEGLGETYPNFEESWIALQGHARPDDPRAWAGELTDLETAAGMLAMKPEEVRRKILSCQFVGFAMQGAVLLPARQFRDGAPLPGVSQVMALAHGLPRVAWRWLMTPHLDMQHQIPLADLEAGRLEDVLDAARRDFN